QKLVEQPGRLDRVAGPLQLLGDGELVLHLPVLPPPAGVPGVNCLGGGELDQQLPRVVLPPEQLVPPDQPAAGTPTELVVPLPDELVDPALQGLDGDVLHPGVELEFLSQNEPGGRGDVARGVGERLLPELAAAVLVAALD